MTGIKSTAAFALSFIAGLHQKLVKRFPSYPPVVGILCVILCVVLLIVSVSVPFGEVSTMVVVAVTFLVIHSLQIPLLKRQDSRWTPRLALSGISVCFLTAVLIILSSIFPSALSVAETLLSIVVSGHMIIVKNTAGTWYSLRGIGDDILVRLSWIVLVITSLQCGLIIALAVFQHFNTTHLRPDAVWIVPAISPFMCSMILLLLYLKVRTRKTAVSILAVTNFVICLASIAVFAWGYWNRWSFRTMFVAQQTCAVVNQVVSPVSQILHLCRINGGPLDNDSDEFPVALRFDDSQVALGINSNGALRPSSEHASSLHDDVTRGSPPHASTSQMV